MARLVKLSETQLTFLAGALTRTRENNPNIVLPGTRWQTIRSLRRLGLIARHPDDGTPTGGWLYLTWLGLEAARAAQDPDTLSYEVRRPK